MSNKKIVYPHLKSHIMPSSILSYSIYFEHSVWVMQDGTAYGIGNNDDARISMTLPKKIFKKDTQIRIKDNDGFECKFISAVCGGHYTLYLVSIQSQRKLVLCYKNYSPHFLRIGDFNPQFIFGGCEICGAIDNEGGFIIIEVLHIFAHYLETIKTLYLPIKYNGEMPVKMAFFQERTIILGSHGHVFEYKWDTIIDVRELSSTKIVDISGIFRYCIALSDEGRVYLCGLVQNNSFYYDSEFKSDKFIQIEDNRFSNFVGVYAGSYHSFFKTIDGRFYGCGYNGFKQVLPKNANEHLIKFPEPITISNNITGCIAAALASVFFIDCELPPNMPNQKILDFNPIQSQKVEPISTNINQKLTIQKVEQIKPSKTVSNVIQTKPPQKVEKVQPPPSLSNEQKIKKQALLLKEEKSHLIIENETLKNENESLKKVNVTIKNENETLKKENVKIKNKNETLKKENVKIKNKNEIINKSVLILKEKNFSILKENDSLKKQVTNNMIEIENYQKSEQEYKDKIKDLEKQLELIKRKESKNNIKEINTIKILDALTIDEFKIIKKVNKDSISEVFEVSKSELFLLKVFDRGVFKNEDENFSDFEIMRRFLREYELLNNFNHPNIVKTLGFFFGDFSHKPSILLEYCPFNLSQKVKHLNSDEQVQIIVEISCAMSQVHSAGIIHRDLKLESILIDENMHAKLTDFGLCTFIDDESKTLNHTQINGMIKFMAPEIVDESTKYNEKIDVYAFGMICYLILSCGENPKIKLFDSLNVRNFKFPESITCFAKELISKCWSLNPSDRPTFLEISELLERNKEKLFFHTK